MLARWASFAVGLGLVLAPLALGYRSVAPILHDVAVGSLVCVATLAALERPHARLALAAPAIWLVVSARSASEHAAAVAELVAGALLLLLVPVVSTRPALPRLPRGHGAGARA